MHPGSDAGGRAAEARARVASVSPGTTTAASTARPLWANGQRPRRSNAQRFDSVTLDAQLNPGDLRRSERRTRFHDPRAVTREIQNAGRDPNLPAGPAPQEGSPVISARGGTMQTSPTRPIIVQGSRRWPAQATLVPIFQAALGKASIVAGQRRRLSHRCPLESAR